MTNTDGSGDSNLFAEISTVLKSHRLDRWEIFRHAASILILIGIIVSMSSNSWFVISMDTSNFFGESTNSKIGYGLTGIETYDEYMIEGIVIETKVMVPFSECDGWGSSDLFSDEEAANSGLQCDTMSIFGKVMILAYLFTASLIIGLVVTSFYATFRKPTGDFWTDKYPKYQLIISRTSSLIPLIAILIYAFIGLGHDLEKLESATALGENMTAGLGATWWLMSLLTITYAGLVFRDELREWIPKFRAYLKKSKSSE